MVYAAGVTSCIAFAIFFRFQNKGRAQEEFKFILNRKAAKNLESNELIEGLFYFRNIASEYMRDVLFKYNPTYLQLF